jgi:hypothetical protein
MWASDSSCKNAERDNYLLFTLKQIDEEVKFVVSNRITTISVKQLTNFYKTFQQPESNNKKTSLTT